jgi:hypothetical protein
MSPTTSDILAPSLADITDTDLESMLADAPPVLRDLLNGQQLPEAGNASFQSFIEVNQ